MPGYPVWCCCKRNADPCAPCNSCASDYIPDVSGVLAEYRTCPPKAITITIADSVVNTSSLDDIDIDNRRLTGGTYDGGYLKSVSGSINGTYTLHQTASGWSTIVTPSPVVLEENYESDGYTIPVLSYLEIRVSYTGQVQVITEHYWFTAFEPGLTQTVSGGFTLLTAQLDVPSGQMVRCNPHTGGSYDGDTLNIDTPPYVRYFMSDFGTVSVAMCGGTAADYTPPATATRELASTYLAGGLTINVKSGGTIVRTCSLNRVMSAAVQEMAINDDYPSVDDPLLEQISPWGFNTSTPPALPISNDNWCNYIGQAKLSLASNVWTLEVGPSTAKITLTKSDKYGPIGLYTLVATTVVHDSASGYDLEFVAGTIGVT